MPPELANGSHRVNLSLQGNSERHDGWIVQKFGGTSVGKFAEKIAEDVVSYFPLSDAEVKLMGRSHIKNNRIALVCSARSAATKAEGTTNRYFRTGVLIVLIELGCFERRRRL